MTSIDDITTGLSELGYEPGEDYFAEAERLLPNGDYRLKARIVLDDNTLLVHSFVGNGVLNWTVRMTENTPTAVVLAAAKAAL